jgi:hypothetical protein
LTLFLTQATYPADSNREVKLEALRFTLKLALVSLCFRENYHQSSIQHEKRSSSQHFNDSSPSRTIGTEIVCPRVERRNHDAFSFNNLTRGKVCILGSRLQLSRECCKIVATQCWPSEKREETKFSRLHQKRPPSNSRES